MTLLSSQRGNELRRSFSYGMLLFLLWQLPQSAQAGELKVLLAISDKSPHYQEYVLALRDKLPRNVAITVQDQVVVALPGKPEYDLVVAVGVKASEWAAEADPPLLAAMIPSVRFPELQARRRVKGSLSAIFIDQPPSRQVSILRTLLPRRKRVGILHSPAAWAETDMLRAELSRKNLQVVGQVAEPEHLSVALEKLLPGIDVMLAVPDSAIFNSSSIRNILIASYQRGVPLVGLSQGYVNAGALYAVFSTPEQLAEQTAAALQQFEQTHRLPPARFPAAYSVLVNHEVARSLGIVLPAEAEIKRQVGMEEEAQ